MKFFSEIAQANLITKKSLEKKLYKHTRKGEREAGRKRHQHGHADARWIYIHMREKSNLTVLSTLLFFFSEKMLRAWSCWKIFFREDFWFSLSSGCVNDFCFGYFFSLSPTAWTTAQKMKVFNAQLRNSFIPKKPKKNLLKPPRNNHKRFVLKIMKFNGSAVAEVFF